MIRILAIIAIVIGALVYAPEISQNRGYLLVSFDSYTTYETTIINALFMAAVFYFVLMLLEWLLKKLFAMNRITRGWLGGRKTLKAQKNMQQGMLALFEGNIPQAKKLLTRSAKRCEAPELSYIAAARAAQQQEDYSQRDDYLQQAIDSNKASQLAVSLVWAELQIEANQFDNALATLNQLAAQHPKNKRIALLYTQVYPALSQWQLLLDLLHDKEKLLKELNLDLDDLLKTAYQQRFKQLAAEDAEQLDLFWHKKSPRWMRKELCYQMFVLDAYIANQQHQYASQFLQEKLSKQFSLPLLAYLQDLPLQEPKLFIALLEKRLPKEQQKGLLHQALGELYKQGGDNEKAIAHLQQSVETQPRARDYLLLAQLLEEKGHTAEANQYYQAGLKFAMSLQCNVVAVDS